MRTAISAAEFDALQAQHRAVAGRRGLFGNAIHCYKRAADGSVVDQHYSHREHALPVIERIRATGEFFVLSA